MLVKRKIATVLIKNECLSLKNHCIDTTVGKNGNRLFKVNSIIKNYVVHLLATYETVKRQHDLSRIRDLSNVQTSAWLLRIPTV